MSREEEATGAARLPYSPAELHGPAHIGRCPTAPQQARARVGPSECRGGAAFVPVAA